MTGTFCVTAHHFRIREARSGDEAGIHESHMRSIREVCSRDHTADEISGWGNRPLENRWVEAIKTGYVWVVESQDRIYGHACIRISFEDGEPQGRIVGLYLAPEALSKGLGKKLAQIMIETARKQNEKTVTLSSTITAHEFYKSLGFVDTGPLNTADIGGGPVRYYPMAFTISESKVKHAR